MTTIAEKIDQALEIIAEETGDRLSELDIQHSLKPYFETDTSMPKEYRLGNPALGFGGKLRRSSQNSHLYVSAYSEDMKGDIPERLNRINARLKELG